MSSGPRGQAALAGVARTPASPRTVCTIPGCPRPAAQRGRCSAHAQTTTQRGYGIPHQRERAAALPGAACEACGCRQNLQRDHRDPFLRGMAREASANKRWLCSCTEHACHQRLGVRTDGRGGQLVETA